MNQQPKLRTAFKWILWVFLIQFVLGNISAAIYAYKFTHFFADASDWDVAHPKNILDKTWKLFRGPEFGKDTDEILPSFPFQDLSFRTEKGQRVAAWYATVPQAKGTVCLFHGLTSNKAFYLPEAQYFRNQGYNVLLTDFSGHGQSEGMTTTIGYREAEDVKLAYEYLQQRGEKRIFLFGGSMGAVAIARAIAVYQLHPAGAILEIPFDALLDHIKARGRTFGFPQTLFALPVTCWIGIESGFPVFSHKTSSYARQIDCPVLLQWGTKDHLVMPEETNRIFNNLATKHKKLVVYEDAVHSSLLRQDPLKWQQEVQQFLAAY
ncbi:MAG: alpha/beta hydrolase [Flavisolibacter sp.]